MMTAMTIQQWSPNPKRLNLFALSFFQKGFGGFWASRIWLFSVSGLHPRNPYAQSGLMSGSRISASPIVDSPAILPSDTPVNVFGTTLFTGSRLPHVTLQDGTALYDKLDQDFGSFTIVISHAATADFTQKATKFVESIRSRGYSASSLVVEPTFPFDIAAEMHLHELMIVRSDLILCHTSKHASVCVSSDEVVDTITGITASGDQVLQVVTQTRAFYVDNGYQSYIRKKFMDRLRPLNTIYTAAVGLENKTKGEAVAIVKAKAAEWKAETKGELTSVGKSKQL